MTVVNDERSNSVVVFGTSDDIRLVTNLVDKLDIVLAQVRIEVVIADVTVGDNDQTGINALGLKIDGDKLVGFSGGIGGDAFKLSNGTVTRPGTSGHMDLAMEIAIGTTPRKNNTTILSHPSIVTSHGKEAYIFLGETRPVVTGTLSAAGATTTTGGLTTSSTVTQQPIGTRLTVEPFIGVDGSINLNVTQKVEDVTGEVIVDQNRQYIIGQRETKSNVSAKSGDILVFGGFRKQNDSKSTSRLGPIPIIGDIFGARTKSTSHQEVIFFLRPTVLTNKEAIDAANAETMKQVEKLPSKDDIKANLDPNYVAPKKPLLDRILPK
jgi:general secretion pathway protein D